MATPVGHVLVVDDDSAVGIVLDGLLKQGGIESDWVPSGAKALEQLAHRPIDLVVTDLRMPEMDGMELLRRIRARFPEISVIMMTAHSTISIALEAWRTGAADFVMKPFDRDELLYTVKKVLQAAPQAEKEAAVLPGPGGFLGESDAMLEVLRLIDRAAERGDPTVLLRGETGTGKEVAARALHERSRRRSGPFIKVHCAALPDDLLENELFGHEKDAFTGATSRKQGRVDLASGGTLFLDEIGDTTLKVQVKLLQLLQDKKYCRVGGGQEIHADVRFVSATHRDLEEMIKAGQFREDLYFRLNKLEIWMPPLRERPGDVERLARHFCAAFAKEYGRPSLELEPDALRRLVMHPWPGNVRELQNCIERLLVMSDGPSLTAADVERCLGHGPVAGPRAVQNLSLESRVQSAEKDALLGALKRSKGNRQLAARLLGISRRTLYTKLAEYRLMQVRTGTEPV